jgi:hypothetical protein
MEKFQSPDTRSRGKNAEKKTRRINQHEKHPKHAINASKHLKTSHIQD